MEEYLTDCGDPMASCSTDITSASSEEVCVADDRARLTPSQMVERKLLARPNAPLLVSWFDSSSRQRRVS